MDFKRHLFFSLVLVTSIFLSAILIWQGLNWDKKEQDQNVLGNQTVYVATASAQMQLAPSVSPTNTYLVSKVIDGDTFEIKINNQIAKVRMIGVDTPETVDPRRAVGCYGKKASEETKRLIEGKQVILTKDVSETDKYKRLLRYVFLPLAKGENLFINDYLIRQGFAKILTYPPDVKYDTRFLEAEKEARDNLRGLWSECK